MMPTDYEGKQYLDEAIAKGRWGAVELRMEDRTVDAGELEAGLDVIEAYFVGYEAGLADR